MADHGAPMDMPAHEGTYSSFINVFKFGAIACFAYEQDVGFFDTNIRRVVLGTATDVADAIQDWFENGAADGFNLIPPVLPTALDQFVDHVVPELQRRGLFRTEYEATTLREHLRLPRPQNPNAARVGVLDAVS